MTPATLREISIRTAINGNTEAVGQAAKQTGAVVITCNEMEAVRVHKDYSVRTMSIESGVESFLGKRGPFLLDISVLDPIASQWEKAIRQCQKAERALYEERAAHAETKHAAERLKIQLLDAQRCIEDLQEELAKTQEPK